MDVQTLYTHLYFPPRKRRWSLYIHTCSMELSQMKPVTITRPEAYSMMYTLHKHKATKSFAITCIAAFGNYSDCNS